MYTLNIGDKVKLEIRKQGINGEGIGYYNKLAIFVPGAIQQEKVNCEIIDIKPTFAIARMDSIERVSNRRIEPACKFYDKCGGCQMQHIEYKEQLKTKQSILKQSLRRYVPKVESQNIIKKTLGMKDAFGYRNKSQMPFKNMNFGLGLGLYEPGSNHFVYVDECIVQDPNINIINKQVLSILRAKKMVAYDSLNKEGILLYLVVRYLENTKEASVTFIVNKFDKRLEDVALELSQKNEDIKSISYSISRRNSTLVFGKDVKILYGKKKILDKIDGLEILISPDAFHQLNSKQMDVLYQEVIKTAALTGKETVIDCYSGIGITTLQLARQAKKVYGIDYSAPSIEDAKENARINKIENVEMIAEHVEGALPRLLKSGITPDLIIFDPPRSGLDLQVLKALLETNVKRLIYISCNPSTLAKNLKDLSEKYDVVSIQPIDMFPQTASVESITLLALK